jgi:AcrR family transcriptional regulator
MTDRLSKADWISHGLDTLARDGVPALKIGAMADRLKVSRGSFYWHFKDIGAFRAELLCAWRERQTDQVIRDLEARRGEPGRLRELMHRAYATSRRLDRAMRAWAAHDRRVAAAVAAVDARRVDEIAKLLAESGVERQRARYRAAFLYWAFLGQVSVMDKRFASVPDAALDDVAALFEADRHAPA